MDLVIHIPPSIGQRLKEVAAQSGLDESEYAARLVIDHLPREGSSVDRATLELLSEWDREDQTSDPAETERRKREWEEFRKSMNENSLSGRPIYP